MKLRLLVISILLSIGFLCKAQQAAPVIKLLNGESFIQMGVLKYQLSSPKVFYYYIGIEELINNKWRQAILDISSDSPKKAVLARKIDDKQVVINNYELRKIPLRYSEVGHIFRFKVNYGIDAASINKRVFSSPFKIE